ncbi:hypothetical protein THAOC_19462, partial [Thalassiosira oceanica]
VPWRRDVQLTAPPSGDMPLPLFYPQAQGNPSPKSHAVRCPSPDEGSRRGDEGGDLHSLIRVREVAAAKGRRQSRLLPVLPVPRPRPPSSLSTSAGVPGPGRRSGSDPRMTNRRGLLMRRTASSPGREWREGWSAERYHSPERQHSIAKVE